jgi:DNA-binding NarL/FixJ family response regulator
LRERLPSEIEVLLYRGVQLLMDIGVNQAHAIYFELHLEQIEQTIRLSYSDNGAWYPTNLRAIHSLQTALQGMNGHAEIEIQSDRSLLAKLELRISLVLSLTSREIEILQRVAEGLRNKEIAAQLHVSARTVNFHLDNIYSKLHVSTRTEAVMIGLQQGWIQNPVK